MCEEEYARVHRGIHDRRDTCGRLRDDAAQRVGGSTGDDERRERSLRYLFCVRGALMHPKVLNINASISCIMVVTLLQTPIELSNYPLIIGFAILVYAVFAIRFTKVHVALLSTLAFAIIYVMLIALGVLSYTA